MAEMYAFIGTLMQSCSDKKYLRQNSDVNIIIKQNQTNIRNNKEKVLTVSLRNETSSTGWGIFSIFCIQNAVKLKKYTRKCKITNIRTSCNEHVSEYIPIRDRQRFGTTSGLRYFTKIRTDNAHHQRSLTFTYMIGHKNCSDHLI